MLECNDATSHEHAISRGARSSRRPAGAARRKSVVQQEWTPPPTAPEPLHAHCSSVDEDVLLRVGIQSGRATGAARG